GEETTRMRGPGIVPELHGLPGRQIGGGPVGACLVETGEVVGGSTQLPVGHELTVLPVRVGDEVAVPVPEGVVAALVKGVDAGRVGGIQRTTTGTAGGVVETRIGAAGRVGEGTVCLSRCGGGEHRVPGEEGSGAHQGRDECSLSCPFHLVLPHAGVGRAGRVLLHPAGQGWGTNRVFSPGAGGRWPRAPGTARRTSDRRSARRAGHHSCCCRYEGCPHRSDHTCGRNPCPRRCRSLRWSRRTHPEASSTHRHRYPAPEQRWDAPPTPHRTGCTSYRG